MLKVNDIVIDFAHPSDAAAPYVKLIDKRVDDLIKKTGGNIHLSFSNHFSQKSELFSKSGDSVGQSVTEHATGVQVELSATIYSHGNAEVWQYYENMKEGTNSEGGKQIIYRLNDGRRRLTFKGEGQRFNVKDKNFNKGLLYFLVYVSPCCEKVPSLSDSMNPEVHVPVYKVEMPEIEAMNVIEITGKVIAIKNKILNDLSDVQLKVFAGAQNIPNTEDMPVSVIKKRLMEMIDSSPSIVEKFEREINVNPAVNLQSIVNSAINGGICVLDKRGGKRLWKYRGENGKTTFSGDLIYDCPGGKDPAVCLVDFFGSHLNDLEVLKSKLQKANAE